MANYEQTGTLDNRSSLANRGPLSWIYKNFISKHDYGIPNGVPKLDVNGKVPTSQLPDPATLDQISFPIDSAVGLLDKIGMLNAEGKLVPYAYDELLGRKAKGQVTVPTWASEIPLQNGFAEFDLNLAVPYVVIGYLYDFTNSSVAGELFRIKGRKVKEPDDANAVILDWVGGSGALGFADELQTAIDNSIGAGVFVVNTATKADGGPFDIKITFGPNGPQGVLPTDFRIALVQEAGIDSFADSETYRTVVLGGWTASGYSPLNGDRVRIRVYNPSFGSGLYPDQYDTAAEFDYTGGGLNAIVYGLSAALSAIDQYEGIDYSNDPGNESNTFRIAPGERDGDFAGAYTEVGLRSCNMDLTDAAGTFTTGDVITASLTNTVAGVTDTNFVSYTVQLGDTLANVLTGLITAFAPTTWVYTMNGGITTLNFVPQNANRFMGDWNTVFSVDITSGVTNVYHKEQSLVLAIDGQSFSQGPIGISISDPWASRSGDAAFGGGVDHVDADTITIVDEINKILNPDNVQATASMLFASSNDGLGNNPTGLDGRYILIKEGNVTELLPRVYWKTIVDDPTTQILIGADSNETIANMVAFFNDPTNVWYEYVGVQSTTEHFADSYYEVIFILKDTHTNYIGANGNFPSGINNGQTIDSNNSGQNAGFAGGVGDENLIPKTTVITAGVEVTFDTDISTTIDAIADWITSNTDEVFTGSRVAGDLVAERNAIGYDNLSELQFNTQGNPFVYAGRDTMNLPLRPVLGIINSVSEDETTATVSPEPIFQRALFALGGDIRFANIDVYSADGGDGLVNGEYFTALLASIEASFTGDEADDLISDRVKYSIAGKSTNPALVGEAIWVSRFR